MAHRRVAFPRAGEDGRVTPMYTPTIGLEIHAELKTATKMFCRSKNDPSETRPNVNICPVCLAHPGTLPVINKEAVRSVLRVGCAVGGTLADYTEFDRKNYFYPDLPKGYQLSQYEFPLVSGGELAGVRLTRIHLEEDTASSIHDKDGTTLVDYNRAGVPLMELVTEPVIHSAEEAGRFGRELQLLLQYLGVSEANMERGEMRLEANISLSRDEMLGTKVEVKNINSFGFMERAIAYEIKRQSDILHRGENVVQETRGWNDAKQQTFSQRIKEGSADYRYFPDPDLPALRISEINEFSHEVLHASLPELPWQRRERYIALGVKPSDAAQFVADPSLARYVDEVLAGETNSQIIQKAANYLANDLVALRRDHDNRDTELSGEIPISAQYFKEFVQLLVDGSLASKSAKDVLADMFVSGESARATASRLGLIGVVDDNEIHSVVQQILAGNPSVVSDYRSGKVASLQFLMGQCMRLLRGRVNPHVLETELKRQLS